MLLFPDLQVLQNGHQVCLDYPKFKGFMGTRLEEVLWTAEKGQGMEGPNLCAGGIAERRNSYNNASL